METLILPRGVTGFRRDTDAILPSCDISRFKSDVFTASRAVGGQVLSFQEPSAACNYAEAVIGTPDGIIAVLLNRHYPLMTFASPLGEGEMIRRFVDAADLMAAFEDLTGYQFPPRRAAEERITPAACRHLAPAEWAQMAYWKPDTVGQVIFNSWD